MLRVHRNTIYILTPICVGSIILSFVLNLLAIQTCGATSSWYTYGCNLAIGVFGSSLLSLALAGIGYCRERHAILNAAYECVEQMVKDISKYRNYSITNGRKWEENFGLLTSVAEDQTRHLGDVFSQVSFLYDKHDICEYLHDIYQYFEDIRILTRSSRRLFAEKGRSQGIIDSVNNVLLKTNRTDSGIYIYNKVHEDFDEELDILINLANGKFKEVGRLTFCKSVLDDSLFFVENGEIETVLKKMVQAVNNTESRTIDASFLNDTLVSYLSGRGYIGSIAEDTKGKIISVEVDDKAYYYFDFKERYEKSKQAKKHVSLCKHI